MNAREFRIGDLCDLAWDGYTLAVVIDNQLDFYAGVNSIKVYDSDPRLAGPLAVRTSMLVVIAR